MTWAQTASGDGFELNLIDPALLGFGPPGFATVATASKTMDFKGGGGGVDYIDGRALIPVWGKEFDGGTVIGAQLAYRWATVDVSSVLGLPRQTLQSAEIQLTAAHFPTGDRGWVGAVIASPGLSSDFKKTASDDFSFSVIALGGYQFSPKFIAVAAGVYVHSIGEDTFVPGAGFLWRPTPEWSVQITPPIGAIAWSPDKNWTLSLSAYPAGGAWGVDNAGTSHQVAAVKLDDWRVGLAAERKFGPHFRVTAQVGSNFGGKLELRDSSQRVLFGRDLNGSLFGLLGVSWNF
jgi:hypothetical protein